MYKMQYVMEKDIKEVLGDFTQNKFLILFLLTYQQYNSV